MKSFDTLPISSLVSNAQGSFLCTHGGLSPSILNLDDIEEINRFVEPPESGPLCDMLWSDPIEEDTAVGLLPEELEEWFDIDFVPNPTRGCGFVYGYNAVLSFLEHNNLLTLVRAHEVQREGYYCHYFWRQDQEFPLVITVFSAPNYCDVYGNQAAYMKIEEDSYSFCQISWVEHPFYLPNFMDALTYSLPYAIDAFTKLCTYILEECQVDEPNDELDAKIKEKLMIYGKMSVKMQKKIREEKEAISPPSMQDKDVSKFEQALKLDYKNEKRRPEQTFNRKRTQTI